MQYEDLTLDIVREVAILRINRPDRMNALSFKGMMEDFPNVIRGLEKDDGVKVLIVTGVGEQAFCTGADAGVLEDLKTTRLAGVRIGAGRWEKTQPIGWWGVLLHRLQKPLIGAVNGLTAGAGMSLACLCDMRIASENARFCTAYIRRGLPPDVGITYLLPKLVGIPKALELFWSGDIIDAAEAERIGLVNKVVPAGSLMQTAMEFAARLARGPSVAIELVKRAVWKSVTNDYETQLDFESRAMQLCIMSEDYTEGVNSFIEKREPHFRGR